MQMQIKKKLQVIIQIVKKFNVFTAPVCLRYDLDPDYDTFAGGCLSIGLFAVFFSIFFNSWLQLLNKQNVQFKTSLFRQQDPNELNFNSDQFMFALGFQGSNINDPNQTRFFDIKMVQFKISKGKRTSTSIQLQACTHSHWQRFGQGFKQAYNRQNLQNFYCPLKGFEMNLKGKFTSTQFIYYKISVDKCTGNNCATKQQIQKQFLQNISFKFNFFYTNKLINPGQLTPISYFLQDKDYLTFSDRLGTHTNLYISDYEIKTDQSILPWQNNQKKQGYAVNRQQRQTWNYQKTQAESYAKFYLRKSDTKLTIQREFRKIDDMLSYIGGLFGLIAIFFALIMDYYSQCSLQLQLCQQFFDYTNKNQTKYHEKNSDMYSISINKKMHQNLKEQPDLKEQIKNIQPQNFGIFDFFCHLIYKVISNIWNVKWNRMKIYNDSVEQMRYKLDIGQIIEKLAFYDRSISALFSQNQLKLLYLQQKFNFKEVRKQRELLSLKKQIIETKKQLYNEQIMKKKKKNIEEYINEKSNNETDKVRKRIDQFVIGRQFDLHLQQNKAEYEAIVFPDDIKIALLQLQQKIQVGDQISKRIYNGLQYDLLQAFQKSKEKKTSHFVTKRRYQNITDQGIKNDINFYSSNQLISLKMINFMPEQSKRKLHQDD